MSPNGPASAGPIGSVGLEGWSDHEIIDHHQPTAAGIISHAIAKSWELSKWIQQRIVMVRADAERISGRAEGEGTVSVIDGAERRLLH